MRMLSLEFTRNQKIQVGRGVRTITEGTQRILLELGTEFSYGKEHVVGVWSDSMTANHIALLRKHLNTLETSSTEERIKWFTQQTGAPIIKIAINNLENLNEGEDINRIISRAVVVRRVVELK